TVLPSVWQSDTTVLGKNNSLYHKLKAIGFTDIDLIKSVVPYVFLYQKGNPVPLGQAVASDSSIVVSVMATVPVSGTAGTITSPVFAKALNWNHLEWDGYSLETPATDNVAVSLIGVAGDGTETTLKTGIPVSQK